MSYRLYVRPVPPYLEAESAPAGQLYHWVLQDANGDTQAHGSGESRHSIEQVLAQNALEHVQLLGLVPGEDVLFCVADIPARQSRYIAQALPYAVEEQIAQDIDTVHLALGEPGPDGYRVAAIDRDRMGHWFDLFSGWTGTRLTAIFPDAALLPATEGGWSICLEPELAMLVSDRGEWLNVQPDNLEMLAQTLAIPSAEEVAAEVPVTLFVTPQALERHASVVASLKAPGRLAVREEVLEIAPLELLAHADHHHLCRPINLCQGMFSIRSGRSGILGPWKPLSPWRRSGLCSRSLWRWAWGSITGSRRSSWSSRRWPYTTRRFPTTGAPTPAMSVGSSKGSCGSPATAGRNWISST